MKTLIIPDIHLKIDRAQRIINSEGADKIILLGDIFDDYGDTVELNVKAANWLNKLLDNENIIYLMSNHDCNYIGNNPKTWCSGFSEDKNTAIKSVLRPDVRNKVKYFHFENSILFSHAGLNRPYVNNNKDCLEEWLNSQIERADKYLFDNIGYSSFFDVGLCRGGRQPYGGILWNDFRGEFLHTEGLSQIMGHTICKTPLIKEGNNFVVWEEGARISDGSWSLGLDTNLHHYATMGKDLVTVKKYSDL